MKKEVMKSELLKIINELEDVKGSAKKHGYNEEEYSGGEYAYMIGYVDAMLKFIYCEGDVFKAGEM